MSIFVETVIQKGCLAALSINVCKIFPPRFLHLSVKYLAPLEMFLLC